MAATEHEQQTHDDDGMPHDPVIERLAEAANARPERMTEEMVAATLEWALGDDEEDDEAYQGFPLTVNVQWRPGEESKLVTFLVRPISSTRVDELRRMYTLGNRDMRRRSRDEAQVDTAKVNAAIVFEASIVPDWREAMKQKGGMDGAAYVLHRFRNAPLLVDQIADKILEISGGDDERVKLGLRAAKN